MPTIFKTQNVRVYPGSDTRLFAGATPADIVADIVMKPSAGSVALAGVGGTIHLINSSASPAPDRTLRIGKVDRRLKVTALSRTVGVMNEPRRFDAALVDEFQNYLVGG